MQQLRARFSEMDRQMSIVRRMEHICGRSDTKGSRQQTSGLRNRNRKAKPIVLSEIKTDDEPRIDLHDEELNRVLGGGLVPGSLVLIGGEPGIGKFDFGTTNCTSYP